MTDAPLPGFLDPDAPKIPANTTSTVVVKSTTESNIQEESWYTARWRPTAAYVYLAICLFDFLLAPIGMPFISLLTHTTNVVWVPLTTTGGSIFHLSFGAIIGISAYGRTREKIAYDGDGDHGTPPNRGG